MKMLKMVFHKGHYLPQAVCSACGKYMEDDCFGRMGWLIKDAGNDTVPELCFVHSTCMSHFLSYQGFEGYHIVWAPSGAIDKMLFSIELSYREAIESACGAQKAFSALCSQ